MRNLAFFSKNLVLLLSLRTFSI